MKNINPQFSNIVPPEPSINLFNKVLTKIISEKRAQHLKWRFVFCVVSLFVSVTALIPLIILVKSRFMASGFAQYLSLIFSDFNTVVHMGNTLIFTLLETIPTISLSLLLFAFFIFLESAKYLHKYYKYIFNISHLTIN